jgi:hydrogenase maturation protease
VNTVLVAGVGNVLRSDDGFGVEVARRLTERGGLPAGVEVVDFGIRGVHLAYQLLDGYAGRLVRDLAAATGVTDPVGRVLVLGCEPAELGDGIGLSEPVAAAVEPALAVADELVALLLPTSIPEGAHP